MNPADPALAPAQPGAQTPADSAAAPPEHTAAVADHLRRRGLVPDGEPILGVGPAGRGNMNLVLRVRTSGGTLIVKRARPWVERFPTIPAPVERAASEAAFYRLVGGEPALAARMPRLIDFDQASHTLVLEDLGAASDYTPLYGGAQLDSAAAATLAHWLARLHAIEADAPTRAGLTNRALRRLNHEHVFRVPFAENNGLDLDAVTPGLAESARDAAADSDLRRQVETLGERYLADGPTLLHGDFFPGSWLKTDAGPAVIDPEFAFFGPAEWDVGVMLAHLTLARQPAETTEAARRAYQPRGGFDWFAAERFAAVEVIRRLLGVAQLPTRLGIEQKRALLASARRTLLR